MTPLVTIIVPCRNEENTIRLLLEAILKQTYPKDRMEVVVADGMSTDRTRERISDFKRDHSDLLIAIIDNPKQTIPSGLNLAIRASKGEIIVRLDAHSAPDPDYVARCEDALKKGLGDSVGGVWDIRPGGAGWMAKSIAKAASHPLGVGDAQYRFADSAQEVDTVPFGAFYKDLIDRIGGFNENLLTNEDYEFNVRLRQSGGRIWLDPAIRSSYFSRSNLTGLARQYWRYGYWKAKMLRQYPTSIRWRQVLPPLFVVSLVILPILWSQIGLAGWIFVIELASYLLILSLAGFQSSWKNKDASLILGVPLAISTMHLAWGSAFIFSMIGSIF